MSANITQLVLYKSGALSLECQSTAAWSAPGQAYTSLTVPLDFGAWKAAGMCAHSVGAQVAWQAMSPSANTGVGLFLMPGIIPLAYWAGNDSGPADYTPGCSANGAGPTPCRADLTDVWNALIEAGEFHYLAPLTYGNSVNGPRLWNAELLILWK